MWSLFLSIGLLFVNVYESTSNDVDLGDPIKTFSNKLFTKLGHAENGNMVFSPYSIHTTMAMALAGSPEDSKTYKVRKLFLLF